MAGRIDDLTIQIRTEFKDDATPKIKSSVKALDEYSKSLNSFEKRFKTVAQLEASPSLELEDKASLPLSESQKTLNTINKQKARPGISVKDEATKTVRELETELTRLNRRKATVTTEAQDRATSLIDKVRGKLEGLDGRTGEMLLTAYDIASEKISSVRSRATELIRKPWDMTVNVIDKATTPLRNIYNWITSIQGIVTTWFAGESFKKLISDPIGIADFYKTAETGFTTMLGSAEKAQSMMNDINEFAIATPFEAQGLVDISQKMLAMGWAADDILPDLNSIGNAMSAMGKGEDGIDRVTLALSQMRAKGKVSAEEMNQLTETGISGWKYLSEAMGVSTAEAQDMVSKGLIPVDEAIRGIINGMSEFDGFMKKTANDTIGGLLSQIEESVSVNIFKPWGEGLKDGVQPGLARINDLLSDTLQGSSSVQDALKRTGEQLGSAVMGTAAELAEGLSNIVNTVEFRNGSLSEKVTILMREGIEKPIGQWWNSGGREKVTNIAKQGMELLGNVIKESIPVIVEAAFSNPVTGTLAMGWGLKLGGNLINGLTSTVTGGKRAITNTMNVFNGIANLKNVGFGGFTSAVKESGSLVSALAKIGKTTSTTATGLSNVTKSTSELTSAFLKTSKNGGGLVNAFLEMREAGSAATTTTSGFSSLLSSINPVTLGVTASVAAVSAAFLHFKSIADHALDSYKEEIKRTDELLSKNDTLVSSIRNNIDVRKDSIESLMLESVQAQTLTDRIFDLAESQQQSAQTQSEINGWLEQIKGIYPEVNLQYDEATRRLYDEEGAVYATRDALKEKIKTLKDVMVAQSALNIMNEASGDYMKSMMALPSLQEEVSKYETLYTDAQDRLQSLLSEGINIGNYKEIMEAQSQAKGFKEELENAKAALDSTNEALSLTGQQIMQAGQLADTDGVAFLQTLNNELVNAGIISQSTADTFTASFTQIKDEALPAGAEAGNNYATGLSSAKDTIETSTDEMFGPVYTKAEETSLKMAEEGNKAGTSWLDKFKSAIGGIGSWISEKVSWAGSMFSALQPGNLMNSIEGHAYGGIMDSPHIGLVAEDGPEAIIPLGNKRRGRGIDLWRQAGARLGVYPHAEGGISSGVDPQTPTAGSVAISGNITSSMTTGFSLAENETNTFAQNVTSIIGAMNRENINSDNAFTESFIQAVSTLLTSGTSGFTELSNIIRSNLSNSEGKVTDFTSNVATTMNQGFVSTFPSLIQAGMNSAVTQTQNGMNAMISLLSSRVSTFNSLGQSFMTEMVSGINSKRSEVTSTADSLVLELKSRFEEGLGIHSPSRYMNWVGQMMMSGLIGGLSGSKLSSFVDSMIGDMKVSFSNGSFDPYQLVQYLGNDSTVALMGRISDVDMSDLSSGSWVYPVQGTPYHENAPFHEWRGTRYHQGIDLMASHGVPILSVMPGTVTYSGGAGGTGYGNHVIVDHGNGFETVYAHFLSNSVTKGQSVTAGQQLGLGDSTGNSTGDHLHFELWDQKTGVEQDPTSFLQGSSFTAGNPLVNAIQQAYNSLNGIGGTTKGSIPWDFSAGVTQWLPYVQQALDITGQSREYTNDILWAIQNESGGNPNAINDWDYNAKVLNDPSRGLLQTIGSTFNAYRNPSLSNNIYDPLSNIVAGINYMVDRYGSIEAVMANRRTKWSGYSTGTDSATPGLHWVGENGPELLQFRGGERVYTAEESMRIAKGTRLNAVNGIQANTVKYSEPSPTKSVQVPVSVSGVNVNINFTGNIESGEDVIQTIEDNADRIGNIIARQLADKLGTLDSTPVGRNMS